MKILPRLYSIYALFIFLLTNLFFMLPQLVLAQRTEWHPLALRLNHWWARSFFALIGIRVQIRYKSKLAGKFHYIICANHFSYLDIPSMPLLPVPFKYVGKNSVSRVPLFGYMFRKIHVTVKRSSFRDRARSLGQIRDMLDKGFNMMIFPEGGIISTQIPYMVPFRDGAFRLSVEKNVPILPVSFHDNHRILPDDGRFYFFRHHLRMTVHKPVFPQEKTEKEIARLRAVVFDTLQKDLLECHSEDSFLSL
ncbi:MAG: 1-acyl-sn-glycerol-3-phosphate acyltransferase [Cyclobacteriaceae bacterium]|nr:1-acyl-sn-glycerol-3-phosphate acyltransferase [Cyclobacteriaceae bacterium]